MGRFAVSSTCLHRLADALTRAAGIVRLGTALVLDATVAVSRLAAPRFERAPLAHAQPTTPPLTASADGAPRQPATPPLTASADGAFCSLLDYTVICIDNHCVMSL